MLRAILGAYRKKVSLVIYVFRMRHKDVNDAWNDLLKLLWKYKMPIIINKGLRIIRVWNSKIYVKGCYTANSTEVSLIGQFSQYGKDYGIVVFEEAKQFDKKTVDAVLVAVRGIKYQTVIFRSNPYLLTNWFVQECYRQVMVDEECMLNGTGSQIEEKDETLYHYMRADVNPLMENPSKEYLKRIKSDNPMLARTEFYGLPGTASGMVFAPVIHKITTQFAFKSGLSLLPE